MKTLIFNAPTKYLKKLPHVPHKQYYGNTGWGSIWFKGNRYNHNALLVKLVLNLKLERIDHYYQQAYFH